MTTTDPLINTSDTFSAKSQTMNAVVQRGYGDPHEVFELTTAARPRVGPDDVLVRVMATSVNTPDWAMVTGVPGVLRLQFGLGKPKAAVRGSDIAGIVVATGDQVTDLHVGDEVFGSTWGTSVRYQAGTFAELTVAHAASLALKPASVSFEAAAASVMSGITALISVRDTGGVRPGSRVLVNGASGGVGTFAVQIAKAHGAHVTGVTSSTNTELVRSLGADAVIDYTQESFVDGDERYDVVLDNVMNHPPRHVARVLTEDGILIPNSIGTGSRMFAGLPRLARAMLLRLDSTDVRGTQLQVDRQNLREMTDLLESGNVRAVIDSVHPLARSADAVARMLTRHARGNVVITVGTMGKLNRPKR